MTDDAAVLEPHGIVPVPLGCCPGQPRCLLCPPTELPSPEIVAALVERYSEAGRPMRGGFYGGPPPTDDQIEALGGLPFVARVRPDLLSRAELARLVAKGAVGIELDALTFDDAALKAVGRRYGRGLLLEQLRGIAAAGLRVGIVLSPGLPGTSHATALLDATTAAPLVQFVRLHPVLVLAGAALHDAHMDGTYTPLSLGEAVTTCRALLDLFQEASVDVVRVGSNPISDGLSRPLAGPYHPAFRQLCDARRALEVLHTRLVGTRPGARVAIHCHPADETCARGPYNQHVRTLRAAYGLAEVAFRPDPTLPRGEYRVVANSEESA